MRSGVDTMPFAPRAPGPEAARAGKASIETAMSIIARHRSAVRRRKRLKRGTIGGVIEVLQAALEPITAGKRLSKYCCYHDAVRVRSGENMGISRLFRIVAPVLVALSLAMATAGCGGGGYEGSAPDEGDQSQGFTLTEERVAPDFELSSLSGDKVRLAASSGQVRLIDFWATWCAPCRDEIPMLNELHHTYREQGLTILAISDEKPEVIREFADEFAMDYTTLIDDSEVSQNYGVQGLPMAFLVDRDGKIVDSIMGAKSRKHLEKRIRELLEQPSTGEG
jgi:peroxiredoxin